MDQIWIDVQSVKSDPQTPLVKTTNTGVMCITRIYVVHGLFDW